MRVCGRCGEWIKPDEPFTTHDIHSNSGAGRTDHLHTKPCTREPQQTGPVWLGVATR